MAKYSRMVIMSLSDEEIGEILEKEGESLPDYTVYMMVEELKRRKEHPEEDSAFFESEDAEDFREEKDLEEADFDEEELAEEDFEEEEDEESFDLGDGEKIEKEIKAIEEEQAERKKTLILASGATAVAALAIVGFLVYLALSGQL